MAIFLVMWVACCSSVPHAGAGAGGESMAASVFVWWVGWYPSVHAAVSICTKEKRRDAQPPPPPPPPPPPATHRPPSAAAGAGESARCALPASFDVLLTHPPTHPTRPRSPNRQRPKTRRLRWTHRQHKTSHGAQHHQLRKEGPVASFFALPFARCIRTTSSLVFHPRRSKPAFPIHLTPNPPTTTEQRAIASWPRPPRCNAPWLSWSWVLPASQGTSSPFPSLSAPNPPTHPPTQNSKYVCEYLAKTALSSSPSLPWGIAGRNKAKLEALIHSLEARGLSPPSALILADNYDAASLDAATVQTRLLLNCTGPYRFLGEDVRNVDGWVGGWI